MVNISRALLIPNFLLPDSKGLSMSTSAGGVMGKLRSLYSSRHNMSDAEKAMIYAFLFMLVAIALSVCVNHYS